MTNKILAEHQLLSLEITEELTTAFAECPAGHFGENCLKNCKCQNNGSCDFKTGRCACKSGWKGQHCDKGSIAVNP